MVFVKGQSGNAKGAARSKEWQNAIRLALAEKGNGDWQKALRKIAAKLLDKAEEGDTAALREIGDRLDGKPAQAIVGDKDFDPVQQEVSLTDKEILKRYVQEAIQCKN